jgi:hypothetical protein
MATIIAPTEILATDCIGNSLTTINGNFNTLYTDIANLNTALAAIQNQAFVAKAWVCFDGSTTGNTLTIKSSYNVTSVTRNTSTATADFGGPKGKYQINFTNAFTDTKYLVVTTSRDQIAGGNGNGWGSFINAGANYKTKNYIRVDTWETISATGFVDSLEVNVLCFGV